MLRYKPSWVKADGRTTWTFDLYLKQSIEQWHKNWPWIV